MAIKIKKQYKQADGTLIEVEGTEAEVEAFEKKQRKQKQQIEETEKKRTILYGKDLDLLRKIIAEELAKQPKYNYHYHYPPPYYRPYWAPQLGEVIPMWWATTSDTIKVGQGSVSVGGGGNNWSLGTLTTTANPTTGVTYTCATGSYNGPVSVYTATSHAKSDVVAGLLEAGNLSDESVSNLINTTTNPNTGWVSQVGSGYLMSQRF